MKNKIKKELIISALLIIFSLIVGTFSSLNIANYYSKIKEILTDYFFIIFTFLALCVNTINVFDFENNNNIILRNKSYNVSLKKGIKKILKYNIIYLIITLIIIFLISFVYVKNLTFNLKEVIFIFIYFLKIYTSLSLLTIILYLLKGLFNKCVPVIYILYFIIILYIGNDQNLIYTILNPIKILLLSNNLFNPINTINLLLDSVSYFYQIFVLIVIIILLKHYYIFNRYEVIE